MDHQKPTGEPQPHCEIPGDLPAHSVQSYDPGHGGGELPESLDHPDPDQTMLDSRLPDKEAGEVPPSGSKSPRENSFTLRRVVGKGGFGLVHEAVQESLNRIVAVKSLRPDVLEQARDQGSDRTRRILDEFRREVTLSANLEHPNIMPVHEYGTRDDGTPLMAMKFIRGKPWDEILREDYQTLPAEEFLTKHIPILMDMAQAVAFAHSRGVIHRDLKPAQVLVGEYGEAILADWGLALTDGPDALNEGEQVTPAELLTTRESARNPVGTPAYMAPEQTVRSCDDIGPWTDVYLLGGTLYQLLTGRFPHHTDDPGKAFRMAALGEVKPVREAAGSRYLPRDLAELAMHALSAETKDRVGSADEFRTRLSDWMTGASGKRESCVLCEEASGKMPDDGSEYAKFATVSNLVNRAAALWPDNPRLDGLRAILHARWARAALESGDFKLARIQGEMIPDADTKTGVLESVAEAEGERQQAERQRRRAVLAVRWLVLVLIVGGACFIVRLQYLRNATQRAFDEASVARDETQDLVSFLLEDLGSSLAPTGQVDPLRKVAEKVEAHYRSLPPERQTTDTRQELARATRTLAMTSVELGDFQRARREMARVEELSTRLLKDDPGNPQHVLLALESGTYQAALEFLTGNYEEQEEILRSALETAAAELSPADTTVSGSSTLDLADRLFDLEVDDPRWRGRIAVLVNWTGEALEHRGRYPEALEAYRRSEAMHQSLVAGDENQAMEVLENILESARTLERQGRFEEALARILEAEARITEAREPDPLNALWIRGMCQILRAKCRVLTSLGFLTDAVAAGNDAVNAGRALYAADERILTSQQDLSAALLNLARAQMKQGDAARARITCDEAGDLARPLAEATNSVPWNNHLNACLALHKGIDGLQESARSDATPASGDIDRLILDGDLILNGLR